MMETESEPLLPGIPTGHHRLQLRQPKGLHFGDLLVSVLV